MATIVAWSCCGSGAPPGKPCMAATAAATDRAWSVVGSPRSPRVWPPASGHPAGRGAVAEGRAAAEVESSRREGWMEARMAFGCLCLSAWGLEATQPACALLAL